MKDYQFENVPEYEYRKASMGDLVRNKIWNMVSRDETHMDMFSMSDLAYHFMTLREKYPRVEQCLVMVEKKVGNYVLYLIPLDADQHELRINQQECVGKRFVVRKLAPAVVEWFGNTTSKILDGNNLF